MMGEVPIKVLLLLLLLKRSVGTSMDLDTVKALQRLCKETERKQRSWELVFQIYLTIIPNVDFSLNYFSLLTKYKVCIHDNANNSILEKIFKKYIFLGNKIYFTICHLLKQHMWA